MNYKEVRLGDVCKIGRGSSPRPIKDERYFINGEIPWVKIADATASGKYIYNTKEYVNEFGASFSRLLSSGSLIFPASGTLGIPRFLGVDACIHDGWLYFDSFNGIDSEYLYYLLITLKDYYISIAYGAAIQNINTDMLRDTIINLPDLNEQKRIAEYLCNYDNLIENNRKRIALLEESARLLYQEWFVKFRFPKLISETDKLSSVNWNKTTIGQCSSFLNRGITPKYDENGLSIVINQKCIRNGLLDLSLARRQSKEINPERLVQKGDILINSTGTGTLGRVAVVRSNIPNCTVDTHVTIVRPLDSSKFAYLALTLLELENHLSSMGVGATNQQELNRADIAAIPIFELPENIQIQFDEIIKPIFEQTEVLQEINKKLQKARDELLPKLISGQIKV